MYIFIKVFAQVYAQGSGMVLAKSVLLLT